MPNDKILIDYTNHAGVRSVREIVPARILLGATQWHPETQWMLDAHDVQKDDLRTFAMKDIHRWGVEPGRQMDIDLSIAAQLQRSMELNARMKVRLQKMHAHRGCPDDIKAGLDSILNDREPEWSEPNQLMRVTR